MGKASSSKKVARAARAGGRTSSGQPRSLLFPGAITLVVVLGLALVVYAREDRRNQLMEFPQLSDHIHQSFGVYACGEWLQDIPGFNTRVGIHTHTDGVIHVHPHSELGVGANATLGRYFENAREEGGFDVSLSDSKLEYFGQTFEEGKTECEGVDDPQLRVAYWKNVQFTEDDPMIWSGDFKGLRLNEDGAGLTIYFGDPDAEIPKPPSSDNLAALGAVDGLGAVTTTSEPADGDTDTSDTTDTAEGDAATSGAADDATTTTAAGDETTTTAAP